MMRPSQGPPPGLVYVREPSNKGGGKRRGRLTRKPGGLHSVGMRMPRRSLLLAALCLGMAPLCAQIGDKAGEPQLAWTEDKGDLDDGGSELNGFVRWLDDEWREHELEG